MTPSNLRFILISSALGLVIATASLRFIPDSVVGVEGRDRSWLLIVLATGLVIILRPFLSLRPPIEYSAFPEKSKSVGLRVKARIDGIAWGVSLFIIFCGAMIRLDSSPNFQGGAPLVFIISAVFGLVATVYLKKIRLFTNGQKTHNFLAVAIGLLLVSGLVIRGNYVPEYLHLAVTTNELAAPLAGLKIFADFQGQYTNLLGIPLFAFGPVIRRWPVESVLIWHQVICGAVVLMALGLLWRLFNGVTRSVTTLCLAVWLGIASRDGLSGLWLLAPASRQVFGLVALGVIVWMLNNEQRAITGAMALGITTGLAFLNNPEFGAVSTFASFGTLLLVRTWTLQKRLNLILIIFTTFCAIIVTYFLASENFALGAVLDLWFEIRWYFLQWDTWQTPMRVAGLHTTIAGVFLIALGVGASGLMGAIGSKQAISASLVFCGMSGLGTLPYFVGNSTLEVLVVGSSVWIALSFAILIGSLSAEHDLSMRLISNFLVATSISVVPSYFLNSEWLERIQGQVEGRYAFQKEVHLESSKSIVHMLEAQGIKKSEIGFLGPHGNLIAFATGTRGALPVSDPSLVLELPNDVGCRVIRKLNLKFIIVSRDLAVAIDDHLDCVGHRTKTRSSIAVEDPEFEILISDG